MKRTGRYGTGLLLLSACVLAHAAIDSGDRADRWWDASRAERIGFSDRAAAQCRSRNCDSLQIRSCLNDTLKPSSTIDTRGQSIGEVTATCIASLKAKQSP